jgi:peptide chain release factor 1
LPDLTPGLSRRLAAIERRHEEVARELSTGITDSATLRRLGQELNALEPVVARVRELREAERRIGDARELLVAPDMRELAEDELRVAEAQRDELLARVRELLVPRDPLDEKNVIVEIRGGEGGEEAALFARDLYRMYSRYAERHRWKTEMLSQSPSDLGGFKEVIFRIAGRGAYSRLKFESGVHRVQRVPQTEAQGRIHTSTATVAVLPEAEDIDIRVPDEDLKIDVYRSSGHGGQGVNTTDSAVRITHLPTGIVVTCQDERSQLKNKAKAMAVLRSRLLVREQERRAEQEGAARRAQIGRGERAEKTRTYNFPQDRITDRRLGYNLSGIERRLDGDIDDLIDALATQDQAEKLAQLEETEPDTAPSR